MPERGFDTEFWSDPFISDISPEAKLLYIYLWTNSHCNQAGLYKIALKTISVETDLPVASIPQLFDLLKLKVSWFPGENLVWVKNFIKRQSKSPKFLAAAAKNLVSINNNEAVSELLKYNEERYSISIPYRYYKDSVSILTRASDLICSDLICSSVDKEKEGLGEKEKAFVKLYEENVGLVTPIVADSLRRIASSYPEGWFVEALKKAISGEHRNLNYVEAILKSWKAEGFKSPLKKGGARPQGREAPQRYLKEAERDAHT